MENNNIDQNKKNEMIVLGYQIKNNANILRYIYQLEDTTAVLYLIDNKIDLELWDRKYLRHYETAIEEYENFCKENKKDIQSVIDSLVSNLSLEIKADNRTITSFDDNRLLIRKELQIMPTGIDFFDTYLGGGFMKQTMTGIQTVTGGGKTTMLITLASNLLKKKNNVAFVNLEVLSEDFNYNILSSLSEKYSYSYIKNYYNDQYMDFVKEINTEIKNMNIGKHILISNTEYGKIDIVTLEKILCLKEYQLGIKFDIVMIDYLYLLAPTNEGQKNEQNYDTQQRLTQEARQMGIRNNWAIVTVFQANRNGAKEGVTGTSMAGAFNTKFDMENYFFFGKPDDNLLKSVKDRDFIVLKSDKHRYYDGQDFEGYMKYDFYKKIYNVLEIEENELKDEWKHNWKVIYGNPFIHENLSQKDFILLIEYNKNQGIYLGNVPSKASVCRYVQDLEKNKQIKKCEMNSKLDYKKINLQKIFENNNENEKCYSGVPEINISGSELF